MTDDLWLQGARALLPQAIELRRRIHRRPELGLRLPHTTQAVREALAGLDLDIVEGKQTSGLIATLRGGQAGPTILLRGDMDALPLHEHTQLEFKSEIDGRMHACGHDAHVAMLASAAHLLHEHKDRLAGTVKFMFQPGEEGYFGARHMIEEGMLDRHPAPDAAFAIHISPNHATGTITTRPGPLMASADRVRITITGQGGHASMPHMSRDPVPVACEIVQSLQTYITRRVNVFDPAVLTIGQITAGSAANVIPESAELYGTLRTLSSATRRDAHAAIERIACKICEAHEMRAELELEHGYPQVMNDAPFTDFVRRCAQDLFGAQAFRELESPLMASEDFAYVLQKVPGCLAYLGVAPPGVEPETAHACHSNKMLLDETSMAHGIALHAAVAARYLSQTASSRA